MLAASPLAAAAPQRPDPLDRTIRTWQQFFASSAASAAPWSDVKAQAVDRLSRAGQALSANRRLLALYRAAGILRPIKAAEFAAAHKGSELQREWKRARITPSRAAAFREVRPALVRALAEASANEAAGYYDASLDYGANTTAEAGIYYLGTAHALRFVTDFVQHAGVPDAGSSTPLRPLTPDFEALGHEMLQAYRPPASLDRHDDFIAASALLKEARELDAAGMRDGALLRYLESALRIAPVLSRALPRAEVEQKLAGLETRVAGIAGDSSIAQLFIESARSDLEASSGDPPVASAIVTSVLPRYFAALAPAPPPAKGVTPRATVTLVRWPYT
jgi:hypothetical protein